MEDGISVWQEQIIVHTETGRRVLMCACLDLSSETQDDVGFVIVFDDITIQLQSQRDAAWVRSLVVWPMKSRTLTPKSFR